MNHQLKRKKLKQKQSELKKLLKKAKRPANKLFLKASLDEIEALLVTRVGSSKSQGIPKKF